MLFPDFNDCELYDELGYQSYGYLWTWTFPDARGQQDAKYAFECWVKHARWLRDTGKKLVRVIERGTKSRHLHFHAVTPQRWNVNEIRKHALSCGFGRINVEEIPRSRLNYVAKYLGKPVQLPKGCRRWAAIGFEGVKTSNVRCREKSLTVLAKSIDEGLRVVTQWEIPGTGIIHKRVLRELRDLQEPGAIHTMKITQENLLHIARLFAQGNMLAVGEYRTCKARELKFTDDDKKEVVRKIVEHGIEIGEKQVTVTEWLPDTTDLASVKPPTDKGEPVVIEVDSFHKRFGITAKSIKPVSSMNGKLT